MGGPGAAPDPAWRDRAGRAVRNGQVLSAGGRSWPSGGGRRPVGGHAGSGPGTGIAFALEHTALQDLSYDHDFDAVITVDAMENVPPEDWPLVLANLHRAVRPDGVMYLTVEEVDQSRIDQAFASLSARGLPAVPGEIVEGEEVAGYHYYPGREQTAEWFGQEGLAIADEGFRQENGWGYRHFLLRASR